MRVDVFNRTVTNFLQKKLNGKNFKADECVPFMVSQQVCCTREKC